MNFGRMQERVYSVLRDDSREFVKDSEVEDWLNDAYLDLATRLRLSVGTQTETVPIVGNTIPLPADFVELLSLRLGTDDGEFVTDEVWNSYSDDALYVNHTLFRIYGQNIELYPTPTAGAAYELRYIASPAAMNTPEDIPTSLPEHLHPRLVSYAQAQAYYKIAEPGMGDRMMQLFEQGLPSKSSGREKTQPGPLSVSRAWGPFDIDPEARHI